MKWGLIALAVVGVGAGAYELTHCDDSVVGRFACNLRALPPGVRARHEQLRKDVIVAQAQEVKHVTIGEETGLRVRYASDRATDLETWATDERKCCPFFHISVEKNEGAAWLQVTGPHEAQHLLDDALTARAM